MDVTKCPPGVAAGAEDAWPQKASTMWDLPNSIEQAAFRFQCRVGRVMRVSSEMVKSAAEMDIRPKKKK